MGKNKEPKIESINAFSRMNYLYQASVVASKTVPDTILGNYYGRLMREVSKKVVEKIHPHVKRALCSSCSYPLFTGGNHGSFKVKPHKKKKKSIRKKGVSRMRSDKVLNYKEIPSDIGFVSSIKTDCATSQKIKKNRKPNKLLWNCNRCGFSRTFWQRPVHYLWFDKCDGNDVDSA